MLTSLDAAGVAAAEEPLLRAGRPLMAVAARAITTAVARHLRRTRGRVAGAEVVALVGSGNNGGDALLTAAELAGRGAVVTILTTGAALHEGGLRAVRARGLHPRPADAASLERAARAAVVLDGVTGIGARGALRGEAAAAVAHLAAALAGRDPADRPHVVAVDVPSGIGVDDGAVPGPVLPADLTVTMGVRKPGLLLPPAALLAGRVEVVDLGLAVPDAADRGADAVVRLTPADAATLWPAPGPADHKYSRGVLGVLAGSAGYPGAAVLATSAAAPLVGMVRYVGPEPVTHAVLARHPEIVGGDGRVQAWLVGSGVGTDDDERLAQARDVLARAWEQGLPVVVDAGALDLLPERVTATTVLTPHAGELARLLSGRGHQVSREEVEARPVEHLRRAVAATGATVLLKGAITLVAGPGTPVHAQADGTPWLATAGAGDVLAGVVGAVLAGAVGAAGRDGGTLGGSDVAPLVAAAALVHGRAARRASGGGPITAGDVTSHLRAVLAEMMED